MTTDKTRIVEGLHTLQNCIYDAKEFLANCKTSSTSARLMNELYEKLELSEDKLSTIIDDDFWS